MQTGNLEVDICLQHNTSTVSKGSQKRKYCCDALQLDWPCSKVCEKFNKLQMVEVKKQTTNTVTFKFQLKNKQQAPVTSNVKPDQNSGIVQDGKQGPSIEEPKCDLQESNDLRILKVVMKF